MTNYLARADRSWTATLVSHFLARGQADETADGRAVAPHTRDVPARPMIDAGGGPAR